MSTKKNKVLFFQSEQDQLRIKERIAKLNDAYRQNLGNPSRIESKILEIKSGQPYSFSKADGGGEDLHRFWVACSDSTAKLIELKVGGAGGTKPPSPNPVKKVLRGHTGPVTCVCVIPEAPSDTSGGFVLTGSWDKTIRLWKVENGETVAIYSGHTDFIKSILVPKGAAFFYSSGSDGKVRKWALPNFTGNNGDYDVSEKLVIDAHTRGVECMAISRDQAVLYTGSSDTKVYAWNSMTGAQLMQSDFMTDADTPADLDESVWSLSHKSNIFGIYISANSIWTASADKSVREWNPQSGVQESEFFHEQPIKSVLAIPEKSIIFSGSREGVISVWDTRSEKCIREIHAHVDSVESFLLVGGIVLSASLDGSILQWDIADVLAHEHFIYQPILDGIPTPTSHSSLLMKPAKTHEPSNKSQHTLLTAEEDQELDDLLKELDD